MISTQYAIKINHSDPENHTQTSAKVKYHNNQTPTADNALLGFFNYIHLTPYLEALARQAQPNVQTFIDQTFQQLSDQCIDSAKAKVSKLKGEWIKGKSTPEANTLKFQGQTSPVEINHSNFFKKLIHD